MHLNSIAPVLAAIDVGQMLNVTVSGLLIVFAVLILLTLIFRLFGVVVDAMSGKGTKKEKNAPVAPAPVPVPVKAAPAVVPAASSDAGQISDEIIAIIAAAIAAYDPSSSYAIRSVKRVAASSRPAWNAAGVFDNTRPF